MFLTLVTLSQGTTADPGVPRDPEPNAVSPLSPDRGETSTSQPQRARYEPRERGMCHGCAE